MKEQTNQNNYFSTWDKKSNKKNDFRLLSRPNGTESKKGGVKVFKKFKVV